MYQVRAARVVEARLPETAQIPVTAEIDLRRSRAAIPTGRTGNRIRLTETKARATKMTAVADSPGGIKIGNGDTNLPAKRIASPHRTDRVSAADRSENATSAQSAVVQHPSTPGNAADTNGAGFVATCRP